MTDEDKVYRNTRKMSDEIVLRNAIIIMGGKEKGLVYNLRKKGGNPDVDVSFLYLKYLFLNKEESNKLYNEYKSGKLLTSDLKSLFLEKALSFIKKFQSNLKKVSDSDVQKSILKNPNTY